MHKSTLSSDSPDLNGDVFVVSGQSSPAIGGSSPSATDWEIPSTCTPCTTHDWQTISQSNVVTGSLTDPSLRQETAPDYWQQGKTSASPISVQLRPDEEVIWYWYTDAAGVPYVYGYTIVKKGKL